MKKNSNNNNKKQKNIENKNYWSPYFKKEKTKKPSKQLHTSTTKYKQTRAWNENKIVKKKKHLV